jgi:N-dimethylarginine dimethylaminohydrolase
MGILQRILMCRPTYFKVAYEINPWMRVAIQANNQVAHKQWDDLFRTLTEKCGAKVELVEPVDGLPDMVFTANAGLIRKNNVYLSQFKFPERQGERKHYERWFRENKFKVFGDDECPFEGAGDALFAGRKLFAAHGFRTDRKVYNYIFREFDLEEIAVADRKDENANIILDRMQQKPSSTARKERKEEIKLIMCELVTPHFYHIDTCFCPINSKLAIWHPKAFSEESRKRMEREIELIAVPEKEADRFACNSVVVDKHVVVPGHCPETVKSLERRGFEAHTVVVDEFMKAGGACKCLTLNVTEGQKEGDD